MATIIQHYCHAGGRDAVDCTQRAVLHAEPAFVLQEHDAVARSECAGTTPGLDRDVLAQRASKAKPLPRGVVQRLHLVIGVGEDHARCGRRGGTVAVPALDQIGPRVIPRVRNMDMAVLLISADRLARPLGCELPCRCPLPVLTLAANLGDLDATMTLGNRPECRPRFDRLKLFGIADEHDLGAALLGFGDDAFHLPRADHPGFIDH